jgi:hypothetical protein
MLDNIERRRFFIKPARKHLAPFVVGAAHDQLDKTTRQLLAFPRLGLVTSFKADHSIADPHGLTRFHLNIARQTIAFIENAKRRDSLVHWCPGPRRRVTRGWRLIIFGRDRFVTWCRQRPLNCGRCGSEAQKRNRTTDQPTPLHTASGLHAS